jgi:hypothetical protein
MNTNDEIRSPIDVIRCVYLARMAQRQGDNSAARRWQAKADDWLKKFPPAPREVAPNPPMTAPEA